MLKGFDFSHWQKESYIKAAIEKEKPAFVIAKATEGATVKDERFYFTMNVAKENNCILGGYHFWNSKKHWFKNVQNFESVIKPYIEAETPFLIAFDVEGPHATEKVFKEDVINACYYFYDKYGIMPLVYTNAFHVKKMAECLKNDIGLWVAHYGVDKPNTYVYGSRWALWQYTSKPHDISWFNGNYHQLLKYCGIDNNTNK